MHINSPLAAEENERLLSEKPVYFVAFSRVSRFSLFCGELQRAEYNFAKYPHL